MNITILKLKDRLLLVNQYRILEKLYPEESKAFQKAREILESGYTLDYSEVTDFFSEEMSVEECEEVRDILDMYRVLGSAYRDLPDKSDLDDNAFKFPGFDGNNETRQYGYAKFLIEGQGRWAESNSGDLNTHRAALPKYKRMLKRWEESKNKFELTREDIQRIIQE